MQVGKHKRSQVCRSLNQSCNHGKQDKAGSSQNNRTKKTKKQRGKMLLAKLFQISRSIILGKQDGKTGADSDNGK